MPPRISRNTREEKPAISAAVKFVSLILLISVVYARFPPVLLLSSGAARDIYIVVARRGS